MSSLTRTIQKRVMKKMGYSRYVGKDPKMIGQITNSEGVAVGTRYPRFLPKTEA